MRQGVLSHLAQYSAPLRRFGAYEGCRREYLVLAVGVIAMTALTVPELHRAASIWLPVCLWCCFGFFAVESAVRLQAAWAAGTARQHVLSLSGFVDLAVALKKRSIRRGVLSLPLPEEAREGIFSRAHSAAEQLGPHE